MTALNLTTDTTYQAALARFATVSDAYLANEAAGEFDCATECGECAACCALAAWNANLDVAVRDLNAQRDEATVRALRLVLA